MNKFFSIVLLSFFFFLSCRKDKDIVSKNVTYKGNVINTGTGKGFKNVEVQFYIQKKNETISSYKFLTGEDGNFYFSGIDFHSSEKYKYYLYIENKDHYVAGDYGHSGVGPLEIIKEKIFEPTQLGVSGTFKKIFFYLPPNTTIQHPDTFTMLFQQDILHKYEPNRIYSLTYNSKDFVNGYAYLGNYPMGWWNITLDKTKNGVKEIIKDSIFIDMGGTVNYTIKW